ncbi:hypothetical protein [Gimesia algae]|uniref:Uncharacterized protein n=1 Tax=Gimesia algae TaxID=2527971 RepID=A0A517VAW1_9PLAN|nr:hypothetical protein [Gimesia algae]QDT90145.1 hypothetical protein Pan161_17940 [Gimesia algae]
MDGIAEVFGGVMILFVIVIFSHRLRKHKSKPEVNDEADTS